MYSKDPNFRWIFTITRKIKIWKLILHLIEHIAHLSLKPEQNWGRGGLHILIWEEALMIIYIWCSEFRNIRMTLFTCLQVWCFNSQSQLNILWWKWVSINRCSVFDAQFVYGLMHSHFENTNLYTYYMLTYDIHCIRILSTAKL